MDQEKKVDIRWSESTNMSAPHTPIIESTSGCLVLSFRDPGPMLETENLEGCPLLQIHPEQVGSEVYRPKR